MLFACFPHQAVGHDCFFNPRTRLGHSPHPPTLSRSLYGGARWMENFKAHGVHTDKKHNDSPLTRVYLLNGDDNETNRRVGSGDRAATRQA